MVGTGRRQVIPHGVWTRLLEVDLELIHDFGHDVEFMVLNDQLYRLTPTTNHRGQYRLQPPGGRYTVEWQAPVAGWYRISALWTVQVASGQRPLQPEGKP